MGAGRWLLVAPCVALGCHAAAPREAEAPSLRARYKFVPGMRLVYSSSTSEEGSGVSGASSATLTVVVLDRTVLDSHEIAVFFDGDEAAEPVFAVVSADGWAAGAWSVEATHVLRVGLPPLPERAAAVSLQRGPVRYECAPLDATPGELAWSARISEPTDGLFGVETETRFRLDRERGILTHADSRGRQTRGFRHTWEQSLELKGVTMLPPERLAKLRQAAASYRRTRDEAEAAWAQTGGPGESPIDIDAVRREGEATDDDLVRDAYRLLADRLDRLGRAPREKAPVGERPEWSNIEDLDGRKHSLDAYAGKVLVLDFWFRECGYCMMAMPVVRRFEDQARGLPVTVLSVSVDRDRADAVAVRDALGIDHPVLLGRRLEDLYGVGGCPTLVVLGPDGVVRDVIPGYRERVDLRLRNTTWRILGLR